MIHGALYGKSMIPNEIMSILNESAYLHPNQLQSGVPPKLYSQF